jgi:hypothetical protein
MSDEIKNTVKASAAVDESVSEPAVGIVLPSGTVLSGTNWSNQAWFNVWAQQTFAGTVASGYAQPTLSGNGWQGQVNTGLVFQTDQYNTTWRGF